MTTFGDTIVIKSDQLNGDDLIAGGITITITRLSKKSADAQQPLSIHYDGDGGKPWKPCLTMRKLMLAVWGDNIDDLYLGRKITLYRDPTVRWAGREEGGIRISHMSHIKTSQTHVLAETRGVKKPHTVRPLESDFSKEVAEVTVRAFAPKVADSIIGLEDWLTDIREVPTLQGLEFKFKAARRQFLDDTPALTRLIEAKDIRKEQLTTNTTTNEEEAYNA